MSAKRSTVARMLPSAIRWRLWRGLANGLHHAVTKERTRAATALWVLLVVWALIGGLTWGLLQFLSIASYLPFKARLLEVLLALFFGTLVGLVTMSMAVMTWSSLYRSRSAAYLAVLPLSDRGLFWSGAVEAALWSGWAVAALAVPLIAVLATEAASPAAFCAIGIATVMAFACVCLAQGALLALLLARALPLLRRMMKPVLILVALAVVALVVAVLVQGGNRKEPISFLQGVIGGLQFLEHPLLPSRWAQAALTAALESRWAEAAWHLLLLVSSAAAIAVIAETLAARRLRADFDRLASRDEVPRPEASRRRRLLSPIRVLGFLPEPLALYAAKDLRLFLRDPAYLIQFGTFVALLVFYLLMLPRIGKAFLDDAWWRPLVSVLNLVAVSMALATFSGRFVFPMLSLEGRRLWIVALAPYPRRAVVDGKFALACCLAVPVAVALGILSAAMLHLPWTAIIWQAVVIAVVAVGLIAAAIGIGARLADYNEDNPGKLVAGFGGTVNLLASLAFAILVIAGSAAPIVAPSLLTWALGIAWVLGVGGLWTWWFVRLGRRWFGRLEDVGR